MIALAEGLDVPLHERNTMLLTAGYAPRYGETSLSDPSMAMMHAAIQRLLDAHDPYPGLVIDRHWNVVLTNRAAAMLVTGLPPELLGPPINVYRVCLHPDGLAAFTRNFPAWASYLLHQLRRSVVLTNDPTLVDLQEEIGSYPNVIEIIPARATGRSVGRAPLLIPVVLDIADAVLSFFTTLTTFGTPTTTSRWTSWRWSCSSPQTRRPRGIAPGFTSPLSTTARATEVRTASASETRARTNTYKPTKGVIRASSPAATARLAMMSQNSPRAEDGSISEMRAAASGPSPMRRAATTPGNRVQHERQDDCQATTNPATSEASAGSMLRPKNTKKNTAADRVAQGQHEPLYRGRRRQLPPRRCRRGRPRSHRTHRAPPPRRRSRFSRTRGTRW